MKASDVMTQVVHTCGPNDSMSRAAEILWARDCGCVPVIDDENHVVGLITDRDICMASYMQDQPLSRMPVQMAMSRGIVALKESDSIELAHERMREYRVRRLPVVDEGGELRGLLSLADLVWSARAEKPKERRALNDKLLETWATVTEPRVATDQEQAAETTATAPTETE